jgi:hypothetical protein
MFGALAEFEHGRSEQRRQRAMLRLYPDKTKRLGSAQQNLAKATTRKPRAGG